MANVYNTIFKLKRGTASRWAELNPILQQGEPGFVYDTNQLKIGDGSTPWNELPYLVPTEEINQLSELISNLNKDLDDLNLSINTIEEQLNGTGENSIDSKIDDKIKDFTEKITDDGTINTIKELIDYVSDHGNEFSQVVIDITKLQELIGETSVQEQIDNTLANSNLLDIEEANLIYLSKNEGQILYETKPYEISNLPEEATVIYSDDEIRVLCPENTKWIKQNVGTTGNKNMYYMAFKAYAPKEAVSFKEGDRGIIVDKMYTFEDDFAGIDEYGRKYSICWLALANYDEDADVWTYFGRNSTTKKYLGWDYIVEWYNADGIMISSDSIRINLSNENCHYTNEPYYMGAINVNKLVQDENTTVVFYGGSATDNIN